MRRHKTLDMFALLDSRKYKHVNNIPVSTYKMDAIPRDEAHQVDTSSSLQCQSIDHLRTFLRQQLHCTIPSHTTLPVLDLHSASCCPVMLQVAAGSCGRKPAVSASDRLVAASGMCPAFPYTNSSRT